MQGLGVQIYQMEQHLWRARRTLVMPGSMGMTLTLVPVVVDAFRGVLEVHLNHLLYVLAALAHDDCPTWLVCTPHHARLQMAVKQTVCDYSPISCMFGLPKTGTEAVSAGMRGGAYCCSNSWRWT